MTLYLESVLCNGLRIDPRTPKKKRTVHLNLDRRTLCGFPSKDTNATQEQQRTLGVITRFEEGVHLKCSSSAKHDNWQKPRGIVRHPTQPVMDMTRNFG